MEFEVREDRRPQGRKRLQAERAEYFRLVQQGYSNAEAAKRVGVHPQTGRGWRNGRFRGNGRRVEPPVRSQRAAVPTATGRYLSEEERIHIADRMREKASIRAIAAELGRSPSTVSREIRRNGSLWRGTELAYRPHAAQARADARRPRPKPGKISQCPRLRDYVQERLERHWSPEQIAHQLRRDFPDDPEMRVTHETIYQALYLQSRGELRRDLTKALRTGRSRRRPRRQANKRQARFTAPMTMISDRPVEAADRAVAGHWEGDCIVGPGHGSAIGTLVERTTRFTMLVHLPNGHRAQHFHQALTATVSRLPSHLRRSLTWDQGNEMAGHHLFSAATNMPVYFCTPASPWQRGTNENTNGLLRQYFPKGTNLSHHSPEDLAAVAAELNDRPRKALGWETPAERLSKLLATTRQ
ncbi:IS30 family transposase [Kitasatospora sp. MAA19]|uniref:IS30 family transposase n=1 Tax=Kitasatospora sp. MAA19 TaxID=3035090 RepID=UPI002474556D|nr:IS30 family transposase [Kitasatospora sp. MAA19]MDH6711443.1 IS30 family transposase [Kitasatospora sp. MAA19]